MSQSQLEWNSKEVFSFLNEEFPQIFMGGQNYEVTALKPDFLEMTLSASENHLRPGGSVSGPAQLEMADFAVYFLLLAHHGTKARLSVTTTLNCSFLRKPEKGNLTCKVKIIKHGRTLSVAEARIFSPNNKMAANMELTYYTGCVYEKLR